MALGLVGRKCGMTRIFLDDGQAVPVTVVEVEPNRVAQIKRVDTDGYSALQMATGVKKASRVNKPQAGHHKKAGIESGRGLWEFTVSEEQIDNMQLSMGSEIKVDIFSEGQFVDVTGTSKGKGFAGVVKRHNFRTQDATHGNSLAHRAPGSIGQNQTPGRVFKGKKMAGQMGNVKTTAQNLQVIQIDPERNLLMIKGAVPGASGGDVIIKSAVKKNQEVKDNG